MGAWTRHGVIASNQLYCHGLSEISAYLTLRGMSFRREMTRYYKGGKEIIEPLDETGNKHDRDIDIHVDRERRIITSKQF